VPKAFVVYENRLFNDIIASVLGRENIIQAVERATSPLDAIVEGINSARPSVIIIEAEADGNTAWHVLLAGGEARRVVTFDMERGLIREYGVRTSAIDTLEELLAVIETP